MLPASSATLAVWMPRSPTHLEPKMTRFQSCQVSRALSHDFASPSQMVHRHKTIHVPLQDDKAGRRAIETQRPKSGEASLDAAPCCTRIDEKGAFSRFANRCRTTSFLDNPRGSFGDNRQANGLGLLQSRCLHQPTRVPAEQHGQAQVRAVPRLLCDPPAYPRPFGSKIPAYKKAADRDNRLATEDGCQAEPRGDLMPRRLSALAMDLRVVAPSERTARKTGASR
jgi:hypothetical protein